MGRMMRLGKGAICPTNKLSSSDEIFQVAKTPFLFQFAHKVSVTDFLLSPSCLIGLKKNFYMLFGYLRVLLPIIAATCFKKKSKHKKESAMTLRNIDPATQGNSCKTQTNNFHGAPTYPRCENIILFSHC